MDPVKTEGLRKLIQDSAGINMLAPGWPRQFWYSNVMNLSSQSPGMLHVLPNVLYQNEDQIIHLDLASSLLTAWMLAG